MNFAPYFSLNEFKCKCGLCQIPQGVPSQLLIDILSQIREHYNLPLIIKSGYRCPSHNKAVGGAISSQHTKGSAADIIIKGIKTLDLYNYIISQYDNEPLGIAKKIIADPYAGFVHIDTRGKRARWTYAGSLA